MEPLNELIEQIRKERVILFLGSGFSFDAGAPHSSDICKELMSQMTEDEKETLNGNQLDYISNAFELMRSRDALIQVLKETFIFVPGNLYNQVALTKIPHFHTIITTNYDTLIEDAYGTDCIVVRTAQDCVKLPNDKVKVYKIHGDFSAPENLIVTKNDYRKYFTENSDNSLWKHIQSLILTNDVLFIGYSLEDDNLYTILESIQKDTSKQKDNIYLISPSLTKGQQRRLENLKVKHIGLSAKNFFPPLFQSLSKHIKNDFRKKKVSADTFTKYCLLNDIHPSVKIQSNENVVEGYDLRKNTQINVTLPVSQNIADIIKNRDYSKFTDKLPSDINLSGIPALKVPVANLGFRIEANGITIFDKDDITDLFVLPKYENITTSIRVPSVGFDETITIHPYQDRNKVHFIIETEIYELRAAFVLDNTNPYVTMEFNLDFHKKYRNNSQALKWIDFLIAIYDGQSLYVGILKQSTKGKKDAKSVLYFQKLKHYYQNINQIETLGNVYFDEYDNYSEDNFTNSCLILSYLKQEPYKTETPNGVDFNVTIPHYSKRDTELPVSKETPYTILYPQQDMQRILLNNKEFVIPHTSALFKKCWLRSVEENRADDMATLHFHNEDTEVLLYLSNHPAQLNGNTVQLY